MVQENSFGSYEPKSRGSSFSLHPGTFAAGFNHGVVEGKNTTLYKVIQASLPGLSQKLFHTKKNRAKFQNGLTERIHLDLSFLCVWFLMTHYRKFTMKKATKEISISLNASNFQFWSFKWKKMLKGNEIGRRGREGWLFPKCLICPGNKSKHNVYTQIYRHFQHSVMPRLAFRGHRTTVLTTITSEGTVQDTRRGSRGIPLGL